MIGCSVSVKKCQFNLPRERVILLMAVGTALVVAGDWQDKNVLEYHVGLGQDRIFFLYTVGILQRFEASLY